MGFGISRKYILYFIKPYTLYLEFKKRKYLKKYKNQKLSLGSNVTIHNTAFGNHVHLGDNVVINNSSINNYSYVNSGTVIYRTKIGKFCSIGPNVKFGLGIHPTNLISTHPAFYSNNKSFKTFADKVYFKEYGSINIGNDVWIGSNVTIMDNVNIANGAIIAAGAVVTKDIDPYTVVGGIPARQIKKRFDDEDIKKLLEIKWWDMEGEWYENNFKLFLDNNKFFKYFDIKINNIEK